MRILKSQPTLAVFYLATGFFLQAQPVIKSMSLNDMTSLALENNPSISNSTLYVEKSIWARKTSWDPGQISIDWMRGQINTPETDNHILIMQDLGSPVSNASLTKLRKNETGYFVELKEKNEREIKRDLAIVYNEWLYLETLSKIARQTQAYLLKASEYAKTQFETGESNLLSKMLTETKNLEWVNYVKSLENRKTELLNELMKITFSDVRIRPADTTLFMLDDEFISGLNDSSLYTTPELILSRQMINIAGSNLGYQKSGLTPSFRAGYFNQQIDQISGFDGWQIGIGIPLWFFPQHSRIQMASIDKSIAENQYEIHKTSLEYDFLNLYNKLQLLNERIELYRSRLLTNASTMVSSAIKMYTSGEIGYIEYIQNIISADKTWEDYWDLIREHNQVIYRIKYYLYD